MRQLPGAREETTLRTRGESCTTPQELAELIIQELRNDMQHNGAYHPSAHITWSDASMQEWLQQHVSKQPPNSLVTYLDRLSTVEQAVVEALWSLLDKERVASITVHVQLSGIHVQLSCKVH